MSLDLTKVAAQVIGMIAGLKEKRAEQEKHLQYALKTLNSLPVDLADLKKKIKAGRTTWLVAEITEGLSKRYLLPPLPPDFTVVAADGSHIDVDRHQSTHCYLINIGSVALTYGSKPVAMLSSTPQLYSEEKDLALTPPGGGREQPVEGTVLGVKRSVEECKALIDLASSLPPQNPALALLDGTLILWGLEAYPDFVTDALLINGMLKCLDTMKGLSKERRLSLASYISFPRNTDVLNVLRVAICPNDVPDCDKQCPPEHGRDCAGLNGVRDRDIFMNLLEDGERSALFISPSKIVREYYGGHKVHFFYLRVGEEIARVEMPQWAAENKALLNLTHSLVYDQCQRGHGYPTALAESHEQAVVTGADRENFRELIESTLTEEHLPVASSGKSASKRTRWV